MVMDTATDTPDAVVIIPHYNDTERLERCLSALMKNDRAGVDILVVDNNSTQPLEAVQEKFPNIRFVVETEKGAAAARNRGVRETTAPLLFFIDADCVAAPDWLETARKVAPMADLIGGRVDVFDETPPPRSGAEGFEAVFAFNFQNYIEVQGFTGAGNLVTRRDVFEDVGDFRGGVSEDLDWSTRAVAMGYELIYRSDLIVSHPSRSDWVALRHKWRRMTQELYATNGMSGWARLRWALRAFAMPVSAVVHLPRVLRSSKLNGSGERLRAIVTLFRLRLQRMIWMIRQVIGLSI
ncbi:glycosyltransferase [Aliiroseovarius subalbicans]|uniref:glycosyltransferase family 2 protein n=1 Tax=Aliiroseovarius subalbicans TaxID=2925840 RepID=UPI001F5889EE|nr:glycosyltransferase [Aliiroseovarius subalbicans]MCI2401149.1 glycosyltransferase [Aliiroseovarius subalbicans]